MRAQYSSSQNLIAQKPFCGGNGTLPFLLTLSLQTPRSQEQVFSIYTSQKYLPELMLSWPSTQETELNLCVELGRSLSLFCQVTHFPSSDRRRTGWAVAASRVTFAAKTSGPSCFWEVSVGLGQSSVRAPLALGRSSSPPWIFPGTTHREQGLS